jgi:tRNA modification GTPase
MLDTAGLRVGQDKIEELGISRAVSRAAEADLRIFLVDDIGDMPLAPIDDDIVVSPKADQTGTGVSGLTGQGVAELLDRVHSALAERSSQAGLATHERHRIAIQSTLSALDVVLPLVDRGSAHYDIAAEELRSAIYSLEALVGRIDVENLLDEIFSSFCLGK